MGKRESRQKSRQSDAIRGENKRVKGDRDTDRDKLRRVREHCRRVMNQEPHLTSGWIVAHDILGILNGTERKGEKRGH